MRQPLRPIQLMRLFMIVVGWATGIAAAEPTRVVFESIPKARIRFGGTLGRRIDANVDQWLIPAPAANPGMLGMLQVRDRKPVPQIVPWAGEFAGKYLMSAAEALRLSDDPRLRPRSTPSSPTSSPNRTSTAISGRFRRTSGCWVTGISGATIT